MKMLIGCKEEVIQLKKTILNNAKIAYQQMKERMESSLAAGFFAEAKFGKMGVDPIDGTPLNLIEQLNQMFSDLVVLECVDRLLTHYPEKKFDIHLGAAAGFDVESIDGEIAAECFAVTTATSNRKLEKDCIKLMDKASCKEKYVCFYSYNDTDEKLQCFYGKYPEINFIRITEFPI